MESDHKPQEQYFGWQINTRHPVNPEFSVVLELSDHDEKVVVLGDITSAGEAVRCFFSPFDAILNAYDLLRRQSLARFGIRRATKVPPDIFFISPTSQRSLSIHFAWLAHDHRLVTREDGSLIRLTLTQRKGPRGGGDNAPLRVDSDIWTAIDLLHQRAGLFAWRETQKTLRQWIDEPVSAQDAMLRAWNAIENLPTIQLSPNDAEQMAVYDPEAARWHFVPRQPLD